MQALPPPASSARSSQSLHGDQNSRSSGCSKGARKKQIKTHRGQRGTGLREERECGQQLDSIVLEAVHKALDEGAIPLYPIVVEQEGYARVCLKRSARMPGKTDSQDCIAVAQLTV